MSDASKIEWTNATWNPVRGCSRVSEGCRNCYAEKVAARFAGSGLPFEGFADSRGWTGRVELIPDKLTEPLTWRKPRRIFVNSMSDLFHERLATADIAVVFAIMAMAPQHTFQILTKRPQRAREVFEWMTAGSGPNWAMCSALDVVNPPGVRLDHVMATLRGVDPTPWPLPNVWIGVSVENQATADERIPTLLELPAAVRFLSSEPLLGPIEFSDVTKRSDAVTMLGRRALTGIDWVIAGGESGPGARPCNVEWIRSVVVQCREAAVPCFVKQLGARPIVTTAEWRSLASNGCDAEVPGSQADEDSGCNKWGNVVLPLNNRKGNDPTQWPADLHVRQFPEVQHV